MKEGRANKRGRSELKTSVIGKLGCKKPSLIKNIDDCVQCELLKTVP
tara:strand:- start:8522 stop:8662 length:141 start_codon:yes stop_codon:yes gene_type:complete